MQRSDSNIVRVVYGLYYCSVSAAWARGTVLAEGQCYARRLMEAPSNVMTPTRFGELAQEYFSGLDNVTVTIRYVIRYERQT